jgi:imidazolonepropionase-like amidohydrolase
MKVSPMRKRAARWNAAHRGVSLAYAVGDRRAKEHETGITATAETLAIKAKTIYPAAGGPIADGVILVENGKIKAVGPAVKIPSGARVIQAAVVIPGLIDGHTHLGVYSTPNVEENADGNEMTNPVTPQVRALDSFNFADPALKAGLAAGVTTIISRPGSGNVIGGKAPPSAQERLDEAMVLSRCDLKMASRGIPSGLWRQALLPSTMMGVYHPPARRSSRARIPEAGKSMKTRGPRRKTRRRPSATWAKKRSSGP